MKIDHTMMRVKDLDKSIDFYTRCLGMELLRRTYPNALDTLCEKTRAAVSGATEAFKKGYANAVASQQPA